METVRLPLIDPYFLYDCVQSFLPVINDTQCQKLVEEAKAYHLLPDRSSDVLSTRAKQRDNANMMQVIINNAICNRPDQKFFDQTSVLSIQTTIMGDERGGIDSSTRKDIDVC